MRRRAGAAPQLLLERAKGRLQLIRERAKGDMQGLGNAAPLADKALAP